MLDQAFDALKTYKPGVDPKVLRPIDDTIIATHGKADERKKLESQLAEALKGDLPHMAKDYLCRALRTVGSAASVPTLAALLPQKEMSHMARYALERIPGAEAGQALRDSVSKVSAELQVGVISSLGVRGEAQSVASLSELLGAADTAVARAAAFALGAIRGAEAAKTLQAAKPTTEVKSAVADASLSCADGLLADGKKGDALAIYKGLSGDDQPKHVRLAATKGVLACAGKAS